MRTALVRIAFSAVAAGVLAAGVVCSPLALRTIPLFRVQRVELVGAQYLTAAAAARSAGIARASNVFDDPDPWLDGLRSHPLVADARIERRLPGTIVLVIEEAGPVAFARTPELRPVSATGRILPADPARGDMDLPVLAVRTRISARGQAVDPETLEIVRFLAAAAHAEPGLIGWVSEVGMSAGAIRLILRNAADAEVLVDTHASAERLRELHLTLGELAAAAPAAPGRAREPELARVQRIDVRFHDQIVVSLHKGKS